jgi:hypothetical protein
VRVPTNTGRVAGFDSGGLVEGPDLPNADDHSGFERGAANSCDGGADCACRCCTIRSSCCSKVSRAVDAQRPAGDVGVQKAIVDEKRVVGVGARQPLQPEQRLLRQTQSDVIDARLTDLRCRRHRDTQRRARRSRTLTPWRRGEFVHVRQWTAEGRDPRTGVPGASTVPAPGVRDRGSAPSSDLTDIPGRFSMQWSMSAMRVASLYVATRAPVSKIATTR